MVRFSSVTIYRIMVLRETLLLSVLYPLSRYYNTGSTHSFIIVKKCFYLSIYQLYERTMVVVYYFRNRILIFGRYENRMFKKKKSSTCGMYGKMDTLSAIRYIYFTVGSTRLIVMI